MPRCGLPTYPNHAPHADQRYAEPLMNLVQHARARARWHKRIAHPSWCPSPVSAADSKSSIVVWSCARSPRPGDDSAPAARVRARAGSYSTASPSSSSTPTPVCAESRLSRASALAASPFAVRCRKAHRIRRVPCCRRTFPLAPPFPPTHTLSPLSRPHKHAQTLERYGSASRSAQATHAHTRGSHLDSLAHVTHRGASLPRARLCAVLGAPPQNRWRLVGQLLHLPSAGSPLALRPRRGRHAPRRPPPTAPHHLLQISRVRRHSGSARHSTRAVRFSAPPLAFTAPHSKYSA